MLNILRHAAKDLALLSGILSWANTEAHVDRTAAKAFQSRMCASLEKAKLCPNETYWLGGERIGRVVEAWEQRWALNVWKTQVQEAMQTILDYSIGIRLFAKLEELWQRKADGVNLVLWPANHMQFECGNYHNVGPRSLDVWVSGCFEAPILTEVVTPWRYQATQEGLPGEGVHFVNLAQETTLDEALFHELLHLKHYLEQEAMPALPKAPPSAQEEGQRIVYRFIAHMPYTVAKDLEISDMRRVLGVYKDQLYALFPECVERRDEVLWESLEERRAVNGPDLDSLTENAYRAARLRPLRYIYQHDGPFFEYDRTLQQFMGVDHGTPFSFSVRLRPWFFAPSENQRIELYTPRSVRAVWSSKSRLWKRQLQRRTPSCYYAPAAPLLAPSRV